ncbi:MAG: hypothetical protein V4722_23960 [Bacteroidota bacterium]
MKYAYTIICLLLLSSAEATIRRVKAGSPAGGNGSTWALAYFNLHTAIVASSAGDEVWIAAGTYQAAAGTSYTLKTGVKVYGGFAGTETLLTQRNWITNPVTIQGNGKSVFDNNNVGNTALLDGVTITGGQSPSFGGGMINISSSPVISNAVFKQNSAVYDGGGMWNAYGSPTITNVVFSNNMAGNSNNLGNGGGMYNDEATPTVTNVVFSGNTASHDGGGMSNYRNTTGGVDTRVTNCVFYKNVAQVGGGGGLYNSYRAMPVITNCSFVGNTCASINEGAGIDNMANGASPQPSPTIVNCVFWNNIAGAAALDITSNGANPTITYSFYKNAPATGGNVASGTLSPVIDLNNGDGNDDTWMSSDDGLRLHFCNGGAAIDAGNNNAITATTDITGLVRNYDPPLAVNSGLGTAPIVDMGAYENRISLTPLDLTGTIGNAHTVPTPKELYPDYVTSVTTTGPGTVVVRWEKLENSVWVNATPASTEAQYPIPAITQTTSFRRVVRSADFCNVEYASNPVQIKVVNPTGVIEGYVRSTNNIAVKGITIQVKRLGALPGGPANYIYPTVVTAADGSYRVSPVYFGDPALPNATATFRVTPSKAGHSFNHQYLDKVLDFNSPQDLEVDFIDTTVLSITGSTKQYCANCNSTPTVTQAQYCPIDSVSIFKDLSFYSYSTFIDTAYGRFAVSITDPAVVRLEPKLTGHVFTPLFTNINVTDNVANVTFTDTTTRLITGYFTAGCNRPIGSAVLEFTDVLKTNNGDERPSCFKKYVNTSVTGYYSVRLPARKYKVKVHSFSPSSEGMDIAPLDLLQYINEWLPKDSLMADITNTNDTLNIVFNRKPELQMTGLANVCTQNFAIMKQTVTDSFTIRVFQGSPTFGCTVTDTSKLVVSTSIPANDNTASITKYPLADSGILIRLTGGTPHIIGNFQKPLNINFTDKYGRVAPAINKQVVVTGVKADIGTFATVSPEVPILVLHDPPGDASFSTWQQNKSIQTAMRMYTASEKSAGAWVQAKIGAKFQLGLVVSTENSVWGTIQGSVNVSGRNSTTDETIITSTTSQSFSTSSSPTVVGSRGDLFVGAAINLIYAGSTEVRFIPGTCTIDTVRKLIVAENGFATTYIYTDGGIRDVVIPNLQMLAGTTADTLARNRYLTQVSVWQQVLANNEANKALASFVNNYSFLGSAGPYTNTTTSSVSKVNTVEFDMVIDANLALELGFEVSGSGASAGGNVNFKMETGESEVTNITNEVVMSYTLDDDDNNDYFSVDIKTDPIYSTPVFLLKGATASCPVEEIAQPRDEMQFTVPIPILSGIPANGNAQFILKLGNTSQSQETRTYLLSFDQSSNPNGAVVTIGGSPVLTPIPFTIGANAEVQVTVTVRKEANSDVYNYEGLRFILTDACGGDSSKSGFITANFINNCSNITLAAPEENWILNSTMGNILPVIIKDYTVASLTSVTLEYSAAGTSSWSTAFTRTAAQLNTNGTTGTLVNWNITGLTDGHYKLRLKLNCSQGVVYSQRANGIIDRKRPALYGAPQPTDDEYVTGDRISFSFDEHLNVSNLNNGQVSMKRRSNNQSLPVTVSGFENKIIIMPNSPLGAFTGDTIMVVVANMEDLNGNVKTTPDTSYFSVGAFVAANGNNALNVSLQNSVVYKNSDSTMDIYFDLPENAPNDMQVNYSVSGTAVVNDDYDPVLNGDQPIYTGFTGVQGTVVILKNTKRAVVKIDPIQSNLFEDDKTIFVSLNEGGDYLLGANNFVSGKISNEDSISVYTFIGDGNFDVKSNWQDGHMPLSKLVAGKKIIIDPSGVCTLNVPLTIATGAELRVKADKQLVIMGKLELK